MPETTKWSRRIRGGLEAYFRRKSSPRFILGLVIFLTALVGWLISYLLLHHGMEAMWKRYPLAVLGGYGAFLLLLRLWAEYEKAQMDSVDPAIRQAVLSGDEERLAGVLPEAMPEISDYRVVSDKRSSWLDWLDVPDFGEAGEGCLILVLLGAVAGLVVLFFSALSGAPALLAEVFIDACLAGALYRRLRVAAREHWLATAVRSTWAYVLATAFLLGVAGGCLDLLAPGTNTAGPAIRQIVTGSPVK
ncbi:hypothetical protein BH09VER1_BH09VER1_31670 [soil metagenome]